MTDSQNRASLTRLRNDSDVFAGLTRADLVTVCIGLAEAREHAADNGRERTADSYWELREQLEAWLEADPLEVAWCESIGVPR